MTRALLLAVVLTLVVVAVVQQGLLTLPPVTLAAAGLVAGAAIGATARPSEPTEVLAPASVVGVVGMLTSAALMAANGTDVLRAGYLVGWILAAVVGLLVSGAVALGLGRALDAR